MTIYENLLKFLKITYNIENQLQYFMDKHFVNDLLRELVKKNSFIKNTLNKNIIKYGLKNW